MAISSYGQGNILFGNYYSSTQTTGIKYGSGPIAGYYAGSEMVATLLWGPSTSTSVSQLTAVPSSATPCGFGFTSVAPSPSNGSNQGIFSDTTAINIGVGTFAFAYEAVGTYLGVTYTAYSPIFVAATQASNLAPVPSLASDFGPVTVSVAPVPEPTTLALAGLGGLASLVAFRRKQS